MSAVLIITFFLLGLATYAFFRSKRPASTEEPTGYLPPPPPRALFEPATVEPPHVNDDDERRRLIERASSGDVKTLREAQATRDAALYGEVLDALVGHCAADGSDSLLHIAREIIRDDELRANRALARALLAGWQAAPSRATKTATADLLRVAALSDDAETFRLAAEAVYRSWREGVLPNTGPEELGELFENEYWILSPDARRSGAGFVLKRTLAELRRALSDESRRQTPTVR